MTLTHELCPLRKHFRSLHNSLLLSLRCLLLLLPQVFKGHFEFLLSLLRQVVLGHFECLLLLLRQVVLGHFEVIFTTLLVIWLNLILLVGEWTIIAVWSSHFNGAYRIKSTVVGGVGSPPFFIHSLRD